MKKLKPEQNGRREFLLTGAAAGAGVAIVASSPASALNLTEPEQAEEKTGGYRVTEHISAYYRTAAE